MPRTTGAQGYRVLFRPPGLARTFVLAMLGRFGYAVLSLVLLFTIVQASGSFPVAATATAVFGFCGLAMPVQARLMDRFSQRRILPLFGSAFALTLGGMAAAGATGMPSPTGWFALCVLGGLSAPSLGPAMRAQWRLSTTAHQRATAYSLDAVAEEAAFLLGPLAAAGILASGPAWRGLVLVAVLLPIGVLGLVTSPVAGLRGACSTSGDPHPTEVPQGPPASPASPDRLRWVGPLRNGSFRSLVVVMALTGAGAAALFTGTAAVAASAGHPEWAGFAEAAAGVAAVAGGLAWGRWRAPGSWRTHLRGLLMLRALAMGLAVLMADINGAAGAMVLSGLLMAPIFVLGYRAGDLLTPVEQHTEASTWLTATHNFGASVGTAAAGWAIGHLSERTAFLAGMVFFVLAALLALRLTDGDAQPSRRQWN